MSIIVSLLSKFALSKVKDYIKNNKLEFILFAIVIFCFLVIIGMSLRLLHRRNQVSKLEDNIDKLEIKVERLEITNRLYMTDITKLSNDIVSQKKLNNTAIKIVYRTNDIYYTNKEIIQTKLDKRDDFYFNEIMSNKVKQ